MARNKQQVGRLAMRVEGGWWVAYHAKTDTMKDALELGRVRMGIVQDQHRRELFIALMRDALSDFLRDLTGAQPEWTDPHGAPEHERGGRA